MNADGYINLNDVNALINVMLDFNSSDYYSGNADVDVDEKVDITDVNVIINKILG